MDSAARAGYQGLASTPTRCRAKSASWRAGACHLLSGASSSTTAPRARAPEFRTSLPDAAARTQHGDRGRRVHGLGARTTGQGKVGYRRNPRVRHRAKCDVAEVNRAAAEMGERGIVRGHVCCFDVFGQPGCWQDACCLVGTEAMILATYYAPATGTRVPRDPAAPHARVRAVAEGAHDHILELGGGDASSTVISPRIFDRFVAPYDCELIEEAHRAAQRIVYHTCGGMMPLLERIAGMNPDAMETLTPRDMGGDTDLAEAKRRIGDRVCMIGVRPVSLPERLHIRADTTGGPPLLRTGREWRRLYSEPLGPFLRSRPAPAGGVRRRSAGMRILIFERLRYLTGAMWRYRKLRPFSVGEANLSVTIPWGAGRISSFVQIHCF